MRHFIWSIFLLSLCACTPKVLTPLPPTESYRKQIEVIAIDCRPVKHTRKTRFVEGHEYKTLVESVATGERFEIWGCYGSRNEKFKVNY